MRQPETAEINGRTFYKCLFSHGAYNYVVPVDAFFPSMEDLESHMDRFHTNGGRA